jgi:hypothetical protein
VTAIGLALVAVGAILLWATMTGERVPELVGSILSGNR